jgi:ABC-type uncharacterized transport system involved in gliding motility auxiliary subunit
MKPLTSIIGSVGLISAIMGFGIFLIFPTKEWITTICELLALLCFSIYSVLNWQHIKTFSARRSTRLGFHSLSAIILILGILVIINFLSARHGSRWDLSESQRFSLAPQTLQVLGELTQSIKVTVFSHERSPGFGAYRDLLETYTHTTPNITVEFVDPEKSPERAKEHGISKMDSAVFQSPHHMLHVTKPTEVELTSAVLRVMRDKQKHLGFVRGHGEREIHNKDRGGFSMAREALERQGYDVSEISLGTTPLSAMDMSTVIVAGPTGPPTPAEIHTLRSYIQAGGRLLLLVDPQTSHGYSPLVEEWGVVLTPGIIVDPVDRMAQGSPTALQVKRFMGHDITLNFTSPLLLPVSRHIGFDAKKGSKWMFTELAQTSEESWVEMNLDNKDPALDPDTDIPGPLVLAATIEPQGSKKGKDPNHPAIVIIGNSIFASNAYVSFPGNTDFILQSVAWLADEHDLLSIVPKDPALRPFIPNPTQEHMLLALQVFSLPSLFLLLGLTIWRRRRYL